MTLSVPVTASDPMAWIRLAANTINQIAQRRLVTSPALTTDTTLGDGYDVIPCDATAAGFTVTLPSASLYTGKIFFLKKVDSSANSVTVTATETIDGAASQSLANQWQTLCVYSDATEWFVIPTTPIGGVTATTHALTINNSGSGAASGATFDGSAAVTISYNSIGAQVAGTYLTGNQSITLSGDVTGSGSTAITTAIAAGSVTLAKMANMATASLIYRKTAGSGAPEVNSLATLKTDLGLTGTNSGDQNIQTLLDGISSTRGTILYRGASAWSALAAGTSGFVLQASGAGADPAWAAATGGGISAWALAGVGQTATGVWDFSVDGAKANVDFTGLAAYNELHIILVGVGASVSSPRAIQASVDNGSTFFSTSGNYKQLAITGISFDVGSGAFLSASTASAVDYDVQIRNTRGVRKLFLCPNASVEFIASASAINAIRVTSNSAATLNSGQIYVYAR